LNQEVENPDLWHDADAAQKLMREKSHLEAQMNSIASLQRELADALTLIELGEAEGDSGTLNEGEQILKSLRQTAAKQELQTLLSGEADHNDAYLEVNSGAGGTEAQDWAEMLMRMYIRWGERRKLKVNLLDQIDGDGAGIKSAILEFIGPDAYGWLKTEAGVHRLVRISPFDSNARRHTSFAAVLVSPVIDDNVEVVLEDKDIRVDTYRAGGAGGQHVNKTDSAVRMTHVPTGIVVSCQQERSQIKNRATAIKMLRARLFELELKKREENLASYQNEKSEIGWGRQIRSYVLQPYQLVKDLRTNVETSDTQGVLDGDLDQFMEAALAERLGGKSDA
jgi:peptide chain release factor 2